MQYLYITNNSADVMAIADTAGNIIANYSYDEWGKVTVNATGDENIALANLNPLRYRGYYYDAETDYYYLQSRYYDPNICRFINADLPDYAQIQKNSISGVNIFAYCCNDPMNNSDPTGRSAVKFIGVGIQLAVSIGRLVAGIEYIFYKSGSSWKGALFAFVGGSSSFSNVTKAYNKIVNGLKTIKTGFSLKKLLTLPAISVSVFVVLGNKHVSINDYSGWFTTFGASYKHISVGVSYAYSSYKGNKKIIGSIGVGLTTKRMPTLSFSQTMYYRYDSKKNSFSILSTIRQNIYNKIAWAKLAGALIL